MIDILFVKPNASKEIYQELAKNNSAIEPPIWAAMLANSVRKFGNSVAILDTEIEGLNYIETAKQLKVDYELVLQNPKSSGDSADERIIEALLSADNKTLLLLSLSGKIGSLKPVGKSFRKYTQGKEISFFPSKTYIKS